MNVADLNLAAASFLRMHPPFEGYILRFEGYSILLKDAASF